MHAQLRGPTGSACSSATVSSTTSAARSSAAGDRRRRARSRRRSTSCGSQAITTTRPGQPPTYLTNRSTVCGSIAVRVEHLAVLDRAVDVLGVGLHHVQRPRRAALAADVDQDQRVVAAHHLVGEVQAAGAEVGDRGRRPAARARAATRDHLASRTRRRAARRCRCRRRGPAGSRCLWSCGDLHLVGEEEQVPAGLAHQVLAGVVVDRHRRGGRGRRSRCRCARPSPGGRRACGPRGRGRPRDAARPCRRAQTRPPVDAASPARPRSPESASGVAACAVGDRATSERPLCRAMISSGPSASARSSISPTTRIAGRERRRALGVAQRLDVQDAAPPRSRCCRTGCRGSRARAGVIGQHDRGAEHRLVGGAGEHRPDVRRCAGPASSGETNRPPEISRTRWTEISEEASAPARSRPAATSLCCARTRGRATCDPVPGRRPDRSAASKRPPGNSRGRPLARSPTGPSTALPLDGLGCAHRSAPASATSPSDRRGVGSGGRRPRAPPGARGRGRLRTRRRRPAGRRSRTGSGWRSWSPRACRGTARSPRTAARTTSFERSVHQPAPSSSRRQASSVGRPRCGPQRVQPLERVVAEPDPAAARVVLGDHLPPDLDRHPERALGAPGDRHRSAARRRRRGRRRCR